MSGRSGRRGRGPVRRILLAAALALTGVHVAADESSGAVDRWRLFPSGRLYPLNVADPGRREFGMQELHYIGTDIDDSGEDRIALRLGGAFGLIGRQGSSGRRWQFDIEAGFYGQFDNEHSQDNLGWDGLFGLVLSTARAGGRAFKVGTLHTSSHIGDELIERTGRQRLGYTRHEVLAGVSQPVGESLRLYAEAGWAFHRGNPDLQRHGRAEIGGVWERPLSAFGGRFEAFVAVDLAATEERSWRLDSCLQLGVVHARDSRRWRFAAEYSDGRTPIGELFQHTEKSLSLGVSLEP